MSQTSKNLSTNEQEKDEQANRGDRIPKHEHITEPEELIRTEGYPENIRDAVESPMVTPQMPNEPGDLRGDMMDED